MSPQQPIPKDATPSALRSFASCFAVHPIQWRADKQLHGCFVGGGGSALLLFFVCTTVEFAKIGQTKNTTVGLTNISKNEQAEKEVRIQNYNVFDHILFMTV